MVGNGPRFDVAVVLVELSLLALSMLPLVELEGLSACRSQRPGVRSCRKEYFVAWNGASTNW